MQWPIISLLLVPVLAVSIRDPREKIANETKQHLMQSLHTTVSASPALIDSLRRHYLALESDLWHLIDSGIDTAYVLDQIHIVHLTFFGERFREFNVSFEDYAIDRQTQLVTVVAEINQTIALVVKKSLHQHPLAYDEAASIDVARRQRNLTHHIDMLFDITGSIDFYETIKSVSELNSIFRWRPNEEENACGSSFGHFMQCACVCVCPWAKFAHITVSTVEKTGCLIYVCVFNLGLVFVCFSLVLWRTIQTHVYIMTFGQYTRFQFACIQKSGDFSNRIFVRLPKVFHFLTFKATVLQ